MVPVTVPTDASGSTVKDCCADGVPLQPLVMVNIMLAVPAPTVVTFPVPASTVATAVLSLLHAPVPPPNIVPVVV